MEEERTGNSVAKDRNYWRNEDERQETGHVRQGTGDGRQGKET
jgi:hypothetical protein